MSEKEVKKTGEKEDQKNEESQRKEHSHTAIPDDLLKDLPKDQREIIKSITSIQGMMPVSNPILSKITPEHITTLLSNSNEEDKRDREERDGERKHDYKIMVTAFIFVLIVGILLVYSGQIEILKYVVGAIFGFAGGFGVGKYYDANS